MYRAAWLDLSLIGTISAAWAVIRRAALAVAGTVQRLSVPLAVLAELKIHNCKFSNG